MFLEHESLYGVKGEVPSRVSGAVGKANVMREGKDVTLVSYSKCVYDAIARPRCSRTRASTPK